MALSRLLLMGNHYHLLIETRKANISQGMRQLNGVYTQYFNKAHARVGPIFQGRYKAMLVEKEIYLLEHARYIVLNPVRAGLVSSLPLNGRGVVAGPPQTYVDFVNNARPHYPGTTLKGRSIWGVISFSNACWNMWTNRIA